MRSFCIALLLSLCLAPGGDRVVIDEGFEAAIPDFHTYHATYAADRARAHTGAASLRVTPKDTPSGGAYFKLDGLVDFDRDYEFSAWTYAGADGGVSLYISAAGEKARFTVSRTGGGVKGKWVKLVGRLRRSAWKGAERQVMLAMITRGESWFDDVTLRATTFPDPPIESWPKLQAKLRSRADTRATPLGRGETVSLDAAAGALAPDLHRPEVVLPDQPHAAIGPDGVLTFALDVSQAAYVAATLSLEHGDNLRPGLRAYVLCDSTLVAAPMVTAAPWQSVGNAMTGPAPDVEGSRPPSTVTSVTWLMPKGRHYLTVAGPHFRAAGKFLRLSIRALTRKPERPEYQFALFSDTHVGQGRGTWMNVKLGGPVAAEFEGTLATLRREGAAFAIIAGDMTDHATREQFAKLAQAIGDSGLPVYGCVGNHDSYHVTSRRDQLDLLPDSFPGGKTDYVLHRPPLRFIVIDASHWRSRDGGFMDHYERGKSAGISMKPEQVEWLRRTLAADKTTPTIVVSHYPFYNRGGATSCGYKQRERLGASDVMAALRAAPNVVAGLNGHTHANSVDVADGIACIQNAAFVEWPNMYRVFRVYPDHLEWEARLANNFGFVRESFVPEKALSWAISTAEGDLAGEVRLVRPQR